MKQSNIIRLRDQLKIETKEPTSAEVQHLFPGFSKRFNDFLDLCELEEPIPPLGDGRVNFLVALFDTNRISVAQWLNKDMPPKTPTLRRIVTSLAKHVKGEHHPFKIEAWLKYGDEAVRNPFVFHPSDKLSPMAHTLIHNISHEIGISTADISLERTVKETLQYLHSLKLNSHSQLTLVQLNIVAQIIRNNTKNA